MTDDLERNRLTVFFRWLLAIPHLIVLTLWSIVAEIAIIIAWFAALITGRVPAGLHNFIASWLRYATHVYAYAFLLADPFPPFSGSEAVPDRSCRSPPPSRSPAGRCSSASSSPFPR